MRRCTSIVASRDLSVSYALSARIRVALLIVVLYSPKFFSALRMICADVCLAIMMTSVEKNEKGNHTILRHLRNNFEKALGANSSPSTILPTCIIAIPAPERNRCRRLCMIKQASTCYQLYTKRDTLSYTNLRT